MQLPPSVQNIFMMRQEAIQKEMGLNDDQKKAIAGSDARQLRAYDDARKLLTAPNGLGAYFKRTDISSITTDMVRKYLCFAAEHSKKGRLAATTQRNHLSALNGVLKMAAERRIIQAPPPMPRPEDSHPPAW